MLADRVRGLAGVADARVVRRLPAALRVELKEVEPAALVAGRGVVGVGAAGRPPAFGPARGGGGGGGGVPVAAAGGPGGGGGAGAGPVGGWGAGLGRRRPGGG